MGNYNQINIEDYKPEKRSMKIPIIISIAIILFIISLTIVILISKNNSSDNQNPLQNNHQEDIREFTVIGNSMSPTLEDGQTISVNYTYYRTNPLPRDDIVLVELDSLNIIAPIRIIAVSDDMIEINQDSIFVNGIDRGRIIITNKSALTSHLNSNNNIVTANSLILLNDNRENVNDSTTFGFIHDSKIIGKITGANIK